jgi:hypothetical protein
MYLTPAFCQSTLEVVTRLIIEYHGTFMSVYPDYDGKFSLIGHSLGSVICWDLLSILRQKGERVSTSRLVSWYQAYAKNQDVGASVGSFGPSLTKSLNQSIPFVPESTILLGSPIGLFLTLRGAHATFDKMRLDAPKDEAGEAPVTSPFTLPTKNFYNIFHPNDPVAYRLEPLLMSPDMDPETLDEPETLVIVGKERLGTKFKQFGNAVQKAVSDNKKTFSSFLDTTLRVLGDVAAATEANKSNDPTTPMYALNQMKRVDYALQTGIIDNEYLR